MLQRFSTGQNRQSPSRQEGFSLIELMVVALVISFGIGLVAVNVGSGGNVYQLRQEARQFANMTAMIAEEAVLSRSQWGVDLYRDIDKNGLPRFAYRWLSLDKEAGWQPAAPDQMAGRFYFSNNLGLVLEIDGIEATVDEKKTAAPVTVASNGTIENNRSELQPDIYLYSSGEITAFRLQLIDQHATDRYQWISGDVLGRIKLEQSGDEQSSGYQ